MKTYTSDELFEVDETESSGLVTSEELFGPYVEEPQPSPDLQPLGGGWAGPPETEDLFSDRVLEQATGGEISGGASGSWGKDRVITDDDEVLYGMPKDSLYQHRDALWGAYEIEEDPEEKRRLLIEAQMKDRHIKIREERISQEHEEWRNSGVGVQDWKNTRKYTSGENVDPLDRLIDLYAPRLAMSVPAEVGTAIGSTILAATGNKETAAYVQSQLDEYRQSSAAMNKVGAVNERVANVAQGALPSVATFAILTPIIGPYAAAAVVATNKGNEVYFQDVNSGESEDKALLHAAGAFATEFIITATSMRFGAGSALPQLFEKGGARRTIGQLVVGFGQEIGEEGLIEVADYYWERALGLRKRATWDEVWDETKNLILGTFIGYSAAAGINRLAGVDANLAEERKKKYKDFIDNPSRKNATQALAPYDMPTVYKDAPPKTQALAPYDMPTVYRDAPPGRGMQTIDTGALDILGKSRESREEAAREGKRVYDVVEGKLIGAPRVNDADEDLGPPPPTDPPGPKVGPSDNPPEGGPPPEDLSPPETEAEVPDTEEAPTEFPRDTAQAFGIPISKQQARKAKAFFKKWLLSDGLRNTDVDSAITHMQGRIDAVTKRAEHRLRNLKKAAVKAWGGASLTKRMAGGQPSGFNEDVRRKLNEALADEKLRNTLPPDVAAALQAMRDDITPLSLELQSYLKTDKDGNQITELGISIDKNGEVYLNRTYKKFQDPSSWKSQVLENESVMRPFRKWVRDVAQQESIDALAKRIRDNVRVMSKSTSPDFDPQIKAWATQVRKTKNDARKAKVPKDHREALAEAEIKSIAQKYAKADSIDDPSIDGFARQLLNKGIDAMSTKFTPTPSDRGFAHIVKNRKLDEFPEIRALFGENTDVVVNYANTVEKLVKLVAQKQAIEQIKTYGEQGGWMSPPNARWKANPEHDTPVKDNPHLAGLQGWTMSEEDAAAINELFEGMQLPAVVSTWLGMSALAKMNQTVFSNTAQVRNMTGGFWMGVSNGVFNPVGQDWRKATSLVFGTDVGHFKDTRARQSEIERMVYLGVVGKNIFSSEMDAIANSLNDTFLHKISSALLTNNPVARTAKKLYLAVDGARKLAIFYNWERGYRPAFPNESQAAFERRIANRLRDTDPNYDRASKLAKIWSRYVPFGPFALFSLEQWRAHGNRILSIQEDVRSRDPTRIKMASKQALGMSLSIGTNAWLAKLIADWWFEVPEEVRKSMEIRQPFYGKNNDVIPVNLDLENGRYTTVDLSYSDPNSVLTIPWSAYQNGSTYEAAWEILEPLLGDDLATGAFLALLFNQKPDGTPLVNEEDHWLPNAKKKIKYFLKQTSLPGGAKNAVKVYESPANKKSKEWLAYFTGFRATTVNVRNVDFFNNRKYNRRLSRKKQIIQDHIKKGDIESLPAKIEQVEADIKDLLDEWHTYVKSGALLGAKDIQHNLGLDINNHSLATDVYNGTYTPYVPGESVYETLLSMHKLADSPEKQEEVRDRIRAFNEAYGLTYVIPSPTEQPTPSAALPAR